MTLKLATRIALIGLWGHLLISISTWIVQSTTLVRASALVLFVWALNLAGTLLLSIPLIVFFTILYHKQGGS
jgi:hypothetical protein